VACPADLSFQLYKLCSIIRLTAIVGAAIGAVNALTAYSSVKRRNSS
jgi:hypothetical protein